VCLPVGRKCGECELGLRGLCPAADWSKVREPKMRRRKMANSAAFVAYGKAEAEGVGRAGLEVVRAEKKEEVEEEGKEVKGVKVRGDVVVNEPLPSGGSLEEERPKVKVEDDADG